VISIALTRLSLFSGLLWHPWQLQPKQYCPDAKHSQYSFRQRELRQLHWLRLSKPGCRPCLCCGTRPHGLGASIESILRDATAPPSDFALR
jgi:hypothetical protein